MNVQAHEMNFLNFKCKREFPLTPPPRWAPVPGAAAHPAGQPVVRPAPPAAAPPSPDGGGGGAAAAAGGVSPTGPAPPGRS